MTTNFPTLVPCKGAQRYDVRFGGGGGFMEKWTEEGSLREFYTTICTTHNALSDKAITCLKMFCEKEPVQHCNYAKRTRDIVSVKEARETSGTKLR